MPSISETISDATTPLAEALRTGVQNISYTASVQFVKYIRLVLPLDGYVFWVRADLLSQSAQFGVMGYNTDQFNRPTTQTAGRSITVKGSFHYQTELRQTEESTYSANRVVFTTDTEIEDLNDVGPTVRYIGEFDGIRFQFSKRGDFYKQANLNHYVGDAVFSTMDTQVIDNLSQLDVSEVVVSNSLPIWLSLNQFFPVYPAYLAPEDMVPPYATIYIPPDSTTAIQAFADMDANSNQAQLCKDRVRITMYGVRNNAAQDYLQYLIQSSVNTDDFGMMNMPVLRDVWETQVELLVLAQKKVLDLEVSYYQTRARAIARQLILHAFCAVTLGSE